MTGMRHTFLCLAIALPILSACGGTDPLYNQFNSEAGSVIGKAGYATSHNTRVMTEEDYFGHELGVRFANDVETTINFAFNSAELDATAQDILVSQAAWIKKFPELKFRVYGHTDLTGAEASNKALGMKRALAVVSFFERQGIPRNRLQAVISYGEERPAINTSQKERRNRRAVTEVTGFYQKHKSVIDGKYAQIAYRAYLQ